jgi:hypothetical protein
MSRDGDSPGLTALALLALADALVETNPGGAADALDEAILLFEEKGNLAGLRAARTYRDRIAVAIGAVDPPPSTG